jgi:hypothetical protein
MTKYAFGLVVACLIGAVGPAFGDQTFNFGSPTGTLGTSQSYSSGGGYSVTAYGYLKSGNTATAMYGKNAGGDEVGVGINSEPEGNHEIDKSEYITIDVSQVTSGSTSGRLYIGSVQSGEGFDLYGSNTLGTLTGATTLLSNNLTDYPSYVNIPNWGTYKYLSVSENANNGSGDVLLSELVAVGLPNQQGPVPEPSTILLLCVGTGGLGLARRLRSRRAAV